MKLLIINEELAATTPEFRNQGIQTALLHKRICEAYSTSHHNMQRVGMQMAWTRSTWEPLC